MMMRIMIVEVRKDDGDDWVVVVVVVNNRSIRRGLLCCFHGKEGTLLYSCTPPSPNATALPFPLLCNVPLLLLLLLLLLLPGW